MAEARAERSWTLAWVAAASVVHGVLLTWLLVVPVHPRATRVEPMGRETETEIAIAIVVDTASAATNDTLASREAPSAGSSAAAIPAGAAIAAGAVTATGATHAGTSAGSAAPAGSASPTGGGASEPAPSPTASASGGGVVAIPLTTAELGIAGAGGRNPFLPRRDEPEPAIPSNSPNHPSNGAARAMRNLAMARDRELGLGPEGPALAALKGATSSSMAPTKGRASFIVRAGGDGLVFAVDLVDSEGGSGWAEAGLIALQSLRGKKVRLPQGARGIAMRIEVRSDMKLPNGASASFGVRDGENRMPELTIPDPSNIGARPRRVISARATGTEVL